MGMYLFLSICLLFLCTYGNDIFTALQKLVANCDTKFFCMICFIICCTIIVFVQSYR